VQAKTTRKRRTRSKRTPVPTRTRRHAKARTHTQKPLLALVPPPATLPVPQAAVSSTAAGPGKPWMPSLSRMTTVRLVALAAVVVMVVAMMIGMRQSFNGLASALNIEPQTATQLADASAPPIIDTQQPIRRPAAPAPAAAPEKQKPDARKAKVSSVPSTAPLAVEPQAKAPMESVARMLPAEPVRMPAVESTSAARSAESSGKSVGDRPPVTITGCVEANDSENTFRLTDTSGADAPTSRNWKSGFLRKRSAAIGLVDAGHALKLRSYVGQRIAATGLLANREMQVQSLRREGRSCN